MTRRGMRILSAGALLLVSLACSAQDYAGRRIANIRFEPAAQPLPAEEMRRMIPLHEGEAFDSGRVRVAIENLYRTGRFDDIVVEGVGTGDVTLTFRTTGRWFVGAQSIEGTDDPPSTARLLNSTKLSLGTEYSDGQLTQAIQNMEGILRANGLYESSVATAVAREGETQTVDIRFNIEPGKRAKFTDPIVRGRTTLDAGSIARTTRWKRLWGLGGWRTVTETRVENGLQRIRRSLEKKDLLMARVNLVGMEWVPEERLAIPSLEIEDGPVVDLQIEGARLSRGRQRALIPIYQERSIDRDLLFEGARNLEAYYQSQGYFETTAGFDIANEAGKQIVKYTVNRGERHKLAAVEITGNQYFDRETIAERLAITPATWLRYRKGRFSQRLLEGDLFAIENLYYTNGFLSAKATADVETGYQGEPRSEKVTLSIQEGPQYLIERLEIEGVAPEEQQAIREMMQSIEGQPYSEAVLASDREAVLNQYYHAGYTQATFEWEVTPNFDFNTVDLKITITEGQRLLVRGVLVGGLEDTDADMVSNRISLRPGEPLSLGELIESQKRLYDLGIFARVDTAIQNPEGIEEAKYVLFELEEAKKYSFNAGIGAQIARIGAGGVNTLDSPAGAAGFSPRVSAGITRNNLFGVAHSITLQGRLSNIQQRAQTTYLAPHFRERETLSLALSALYDDSRDVRTFAARRREVAIQLTERVSKANTIQGRFALRRVRVDAESLRIEPQLIPRLAQPVRIGMFSTTFIQDLRDDPIDSTKGIYSSLDLGVASKIIGSESNFVRLLGRNSTYHRVSQDVVFARILTFGVQERLTGGPLQDVPLPERFYSGGGSTHRGFPDNQAGPRDPVTGFPIGGKALLIFGHELRTPLIGDNLGAVLFHDMGNVFSRIGDVSLRYKQQALGDVNYTVQTVGLGFRYRTPIGPVRMDFGYSPNSPRFFGFEGTLQELLFGTGRQTAQRINRFQFHFSLGQTF